MKSIQMQGKDLKKLIERFQIENNLDEYDFTYEVIQESKKGFLGIFGNKNVIVKFTICNITEEIQDYLREFSIYAQISYENINIKHDEKYIYVELSGVSDPGFVIGKDGKFLQNLQYIINQTYSNKDARNRSIIIDVEGYKERQEMAITKKVLQQVSLVIKNKKSITLDPMSSAQRRVVHQAIRENKNVKTMTKGIGAMKRIVIMPADTKYNNSKTQSRNKTNNPDTQINEVIKTKRTTTTRNKKIKPDGND